MGASKGKKNWHVLTIDRMHFGDRLAVIGLNMAKKIVAESSTDINDTSVKMIKNISLTIKLELATKMTSTD